MRGPFLDRDRHSSLPRLGPIPVPPHSMLYPCPEAPSRDCDGNDSWAQETSGAQGRSEHSGSEWLQGWLADTRPGQVFGLIGGHSGRDKGMRNALDLTYKTNSSDGALP